MTKKVNFFKVESIDESDECIFYEEGDLVFGKCKNSLPWPGIVGGFKGYDEEEVQVFTINFIDTNTYAHLESYFLTPLSKSKIIKMKLKYRHNKHLVNAITMAGKQLAKLQQFCRGKPTLYERYRKLYATDKKVFEDKEPIDAETIQQKTAPLAERMEKKFFVDKVGRRRWTRAYRRSRLSIIVPEAVRGWIQIKSISRESIMTQISFGRTLWTTESLKVDLPVENLVLNKIKLSDKNKGKQPKEEKPNGNVVEPAVERMNSNFNQTEKIFFVNNFFKTAKE